MNNRFITTEKEPTGNTSVKILVGNKILSFVVSVEGYALFSKDEDAYILGDFHKYIKTSLKSIESHYKKLNASTGLEPSHHFLYDQLKETLDHIRGIKIRALSYPSDRDCSTMHL
ncbi:hypothetical protein D3C87_280280 [compost metagenome]